MKKKKKLIKERLESKDAKEDDFYKYLKMERNKKTL